MAAVRQRDGMWAGGQDHLDPRGTDKEQDRWGTGCDRVSTCQTHVVGGAPGAVVSRPFCMCTVEWEGTASASHPPKNICIYMYGDI